MLYVLSMLMMFAAVTIAAYSLVPARLHAVAVRGLPVHGVDLSRLPSIWFRMLFPLLQALAPLTKRIGWQTYRATAATALQRAGLEGVSVDHLLAMKAITAVLTPIVASMIFSIFRNPLLFIVAGIGGFYVPDRLVGDLRKARERAIVRALPGAVDVLSLSVEAGLEFLAAIQRLVERGAIGPLRDELATILNDIRLGTSRAEALKGFGQRVEISEVSSFVSVLVQADLLGASIGPVLKQQAERMRVERFQRAEREGAKATQKILIPLVLFIFPAVLIVIIAPVALQFLARSR
ncbi:MAG: type II secretion system F family protein [Acidobacteria bacterium]|nr:type II secretion system F family protein [Acidobacteriota bacterium]